MRCFRLLLALTCIWLGTSALAALPIVTAVKTARPPVLDGKLNDPVWQQGKWYSNFTLLGEGMKPAAAQTRFKVAFDQQNMYFGVELLEPNMDKLVASETQRDSGVFRDDALEIMLVPNSARLDYYHFAVNALGTQYDAELRQGGNVRSVEWNANWQAKTARNPRSWTVEIAIPFVELGLTGLSKGDWALNIARERQAGQPELSSFSEGIGGFHQPSLYATLKLPEADLSRFMWTMRQPYETSFRMENDKLYWLGKIHLLNDTGKFWFLRIRPELDYTDGGHTSGKVLSDGFDAGQARELSFSVPVRKQGPQTLRLIVSDRRDPQNTLYIRSIPITLTYTPLAIDITQPSYRDCIYATQKLDRIEFTITSALSTEALHGKRLAALLLPAGQTASSAALATANAFAAVPQAHVSLPAATLPVGDYTLVANLLDEHGQVLHSTQKRLRKLPPAPNGHEWRVDENNVLLHNGEPFLPFGWFSQEVATVDPQDGYTVLQAYSREYFDDDVVSNWLDDCLKHGVYATFGPYSREFMNRGDAMKQPLSETERAALVRRVEALKTHPGLFSWYMADEPELVPVLPQRAQDIYETVRDADPYHPCIMLNDTTDGIYKYARGGDILMPDPYPCFIRGGLAAAPIEKVGQFMKAIQDATDGRKPAWITPQGFNYGDYNRANNRGPNLTELRNQTYQAVIYGAKGFLWYIWGQIYNYPDLSLGMPFMAREVRDLKSAVLAQDVPQGVTVKAPKPEHMHVCLRQVGDDVYLFAVNTATEPQSATLTVKGAPAKLYVVSEGRTIAVANGSFTDTFPVYGSHVYTTKADLAQREQLSAIQTEIDKANTTRKKPGNLAFEDNNVRVLVSSGSAYGNTPERVLDGIIGHMGWEAKDPNGTTDWVELIWPTEQRIGRVVIYSDTISEAEVQVPEGEDKWRTVGKLAGSGNLTASFEPLAASSLRIFVTKVQPGRQSAITEVEAYAQ